MLLRKEMLFLKSTYPPSPRDWFKPYLFVIAWVQSLIAKRYELDTQPAYTQKCAGGEMNGGYHSVHYINTEREVVVFAAKQRLNQTSLFWNDWLWECISHFQNTFFFKKKNHVFLFVWTEQIFISLLPARFIIPRNWVSYPHRVDLYCLQLIACIRVY